MIKKKQLNRKTTKTRWLLFRSAIRSGICGRQDECSTRDKMVSKSVCVCVCVWGHTFSAYWLLKCSSVAISTSGLSKPHPGFKSLFIYAGVGGGVSTHIYKQTHAVHTHTHTRNLYVCTWQPVQRDPQSHVPTTRISRLSQKGSQIYNGDDDEFTSEFAYTRLGFCLPSELLRLYLWFRALRKLFRFLLLPHLGLGVLSYYIWTDVARTLPNHCLNRW